MAEAVVRDVVIWTKHLLGDPGIVAHLDSLKGGQTTELVIDGVRGPWCKMADGSDGRRTPGLRPLGRMQDFWRELYASRRGDLVAVELAPPEATSSLSDPIGGPAERQSGVQALLDAWRQGWRSDGTRMTRDEMHER